MDIVDVWAQHPTERFANAPWLAPLRRWTETAGTGSLSTRAASVDDTVAAMDGAGVRTALLSAWHGPMGSLISNDEVADVVRAHPDRFAGLAAVDLTDPVGAVREIRAQSPISVSSACGSCPGCGTCRRTTAATTPCTWRASNSACRCAPRSATPGRCSRPSPAGRSRTSTRCCSISPTWWSWAATSGYPWMARCCRW